jgi:hypothetical protein
MINILSIGALLASSGCASIISQSAWPVYVQVEEGEADVTVKNANGLTVKTGKTPMLLRLESGRGWFKKADYVFTFSKPGYPDLTAILPATLNYWYLGNIFNALGFFTVDPATGAMWKLSETVSVSLTDQSTYNPGLYIQPTNVYTIPQDPVSSITPVLPAR